MQQSINISYPPGLQQQTRRTLLQRANQTETDRRTDGRTLYRYIDPAQHTTRALVIYQRQCQDRSYIGRPNLGA